MTLGVIGRRLTEFSSSREFVSAVADAMEAHDAAFFDARILHRDISVGNILITDEGKGLLVDWDLCINLNRVNERFCDRPPPRMGTWPFMSVALLKNPSAEHCIEDDRESALYVLLWTALRHSKHSTPSGTTAPHSSSHPISLLHLGFDEAYTTSSGEMRGGHIKACILLGNRLSNVVQFHQRPQLDALLTALQEVFQFRYQPRPKDKDCQLFEKLKEEGFDENFLKLTIPYMYFNGLEKLKQRGWLVNTLRDFLSNDDWPQADKAELQGIPQTTNKRQFVQDQLSLIEPDPKRRRVASAPALGS
ncbi:hypothetical protein CVT26_015832 [Gymnopilus dilepis]|uniref:Fungal-type protein kinase domain-containing protein n=1 Tax=Gymnopilus dilepis TaxID=231916 RepID=A0A409W4Q1_9AGAR|nr:hypothetical protein CVT26_015832 [Gymnopilus dilepis]